MSLRFIIGRSGSGKTDYIINEILNKQNIGLNAIYIVPEQFSLQAEKDLSQKASGGGILSAEVLTFGRLSHRVAVEKGGKMREVLDETNKSMVLRKIIFDNEESLVYYKNSIDKKGFMEQLSMTVKEFYNYGIDKEKLLKLEESVDENSVIRMKIKDIITILQGYEGYIKEKYISSDEKLDILTNNIKNSDLISNSYIYIDGFYVFTPQEINVISELSKYAKDVYISLPMDKYTYYDKNPYIVKLFFEPLNSCRKIINKVSENGIKVLDPIIFYDNKRAVNEGIKHLERYFNFYPPKISDNYNGIKIFSADNKYDEVENCAINIIKMVRDENIKFNEIAILMRNIRDYESHIKTIFSEYKIPVFIDIKDEIISQPIIELVRSIVDIVVRDFSYESMFRFLKTGLVPINRDDIDIIENYVLAYGIKGYKWHNDIWEYGFKKDENSEEKENVNRIKSEVLNCIKPFYESISLNKKYNINEFIKAIYTTLKNMNISSIISNRINILKENNDIGKSEEYKQVWKIMNDIFEGMSTFLGDESMTVSEFSKILDAGFSECKFAIVPPTIDSVVVGDIERTRLPNIKAVFVIGVNEGVLPSPSESQGIFTDIERDIIDENGIELSSDGKRKAFEEQFLIYTSITKPSHYIYMSYRKSDIDGKALRASSLINKIKSLFSNIEVIEYDKNSIENIVSPIPVLHKLGENLRVITEGENNEFWKDVMAYYNENKVWSNKVNTIINSLYDKNISEKLSDDTVKRIYNGKLYSSISRLERYVSCPYSYFIEYVISAKERKLYELGTPDLGYLFHGILESFSLKMAENNKNWQNITVGETDKLISEAVSENAPKLENEILLSTASRRYLIKRLERISKRAAKTLTGHVQSGTFKPYGFEMEFGIDGVMPPIVIELSNGEKMIMNGKIDRVDVLDKDGKRYVKIIDYKSGTKAFSIQDIYYGLQLQLMIYIDALIKNMGKDENLLPAGVFYFRIQDPITKSVSEMTGEEIENKLLKELKMSGLVLNNETVFEGLDENLKNGGTSDIVPVSYGSKGQLKKSGTSVASEDDYLSLMKFTGEKAKSIGESILDGNIDIKPYKSKDMTPCKYCNYHSICRFDSNMPENNYNKLNNIKDEEIWEEIRKTCNVICEDKKE